MALKQQFTQRQDVRLSPQQIQLMKLLQIPVAELDQRIQQEIEENPALEQGDDEILEPFEAPESSTDEKAFDFSEYFDEDTADYKTQVKNYSKDEEERDVPISGENSFQDRLMEQLQWNELNEEELIMAEVIVGNLDESGYLNRSLEAIVDDLAFHYNVSVIEQEVLGVLHQIQELDPAGVGARTLQECLMLQAERRNDGSRLKSLVLKALKECFEAFTKKHYDKMALKLKIEEEELKSVVNEILKLNPKPGGSVKGSEKAVQQVIPDFLLNEVDGVFDLSLNARNAPDLKISREYQTLMRAFAEGAKTSKSDKQALTFVKHKVDSAKGFIDAIKQRHETLYLTMSAILEHQQAFFLTGDNTKLKPMILKDIADKVQMDISTISRVANSKYVQTNHGVYLLKNLFSEAMTTDSGEEVSSREVKQMLSEAIDKEDKKAPIPDEKLMAILNEKGYNIARRTVAKYREQLNIPVARLRKEL
jgi:RNA polymerase sigma-54 factor